MARASALLLVGLFALAGCLPDQPLVPTNAPVFPTGVALSGDGNHLLVVSSDFDLAFNNGALLSADLGVVRNAEASAGGTPPVITTAYTSTVIMPAHGDRPVLSPNKDRVYIPVKSDNVVAAVDVNADGSLTCGSPTTPQQCGTAPAALQLAQDDPFTVLLTHEDSANERVDGIVALLSSSVVTFFSDDKSRAGAQRMQLSAQLDLGINVGGVRSAVLVPPEGGPGAFVVAAVDLSAAQSLVGADLIVFPARSDATPVVFDVSNTIGALSMRDMVLVPARDGTKNGAVDVVLRPVGLGCCDGFARFEFTSAGAVPNVTLAGVQPACKTPTSMAYAEPPVDRVIVTCQDDNTVEALDPITLTPTDALRFDGRGPYGVAVRNDATLPEAFVTFFLDNSVGSIKLLDDNGIPRMSFAARIGAQSEAPEDGRE